MKVASITFNGIQAKGFTGYLYPIYLKQHNNDVQILFL